MQNNLLQHFELHDTYLEHSKKNFETKFSKKFKPKSKITDFNIYKCLGKGAFGQVYLTKYKNSKTNKYFALKIIEKKHIIESRQLTHTQSELRLLFAIESDFIVTLEDFFMDNVHIYFLLPYIEGGDLFGTLKTQNRFEESIAKFYAGQVVLALEYMHFMGLVYRDLKPENLLIDITGYLKLTDLGFCKKIDDKRTYTLCGTPDYIAPEAILGKGYDYSVDWWGLGVLIFEMVAGCTPFYSTNPLHTYEKIVSGRYVCPPHFSRAIKDIINNLLQVERARRYGMTQTRSKKIKSHGWFNAIKWNDLLKQTMPPSFKPSPKVMPTDIFLTHTEFLRESPENEYEEEFKNLCE